MDNLSEYQRQTITWHYYRPRHTHTWNMLVISRQVLAAHILDFDAPFEVEYLWENFIIRLWLYRMTVKTLTHFSIAETDAAAAVSAFDERFTINGKNGLKAIRDMIEHFDEYAMGKGRGPATREGELDPWRMVTPDRFERGQFVIEGAAAYDAAIQMRADANRVSDKIINWFRDMQAEATGSD